MTTGAEAALQGTTITPGLTVNNLTRSIKFYEGLGFGVEDRWETDGVLRGVMLRAGGARIGLSQDDWKKGRDRVKGVGLRLWIGTKQDIDRLAAGAKAAGLTLTTEPHDTDWGSRAFEVADPDGFQLTISSDG
ncbi:MAG TPA: VOC family protein [Gemmatimonadales bacterium]|nr:VOC family protein [Gemmatimonadales bacterium]